MGQHSLLDKFVNILQCELNTFYIMEDCNTNDWKKNYENRNWLINPILNWLAIAVFSLMLGMKYEHVISPYFVAFLCIIFAIGFIAFFVFLVGYVLLCNRPPSERLG